MAYYYEDTSHYRYSVPACREDTSWYYHNTSAHLVDTSQYSFSIPAHYDDAVHNPLEHACELEAYAEAAANRVYSWDEIHPAYRDHLTDSYGEPMQPPVDDDEYYEDVTNEELAEMNRRCMEYQKQLVERKVEDEEQDIEENNADRVEDVEDTGTVEAVKEEDQEDYEDEDSTCPSHHISCDNIIRCVTTPPPDIRTPNPHPPSPNICYTAHLHHPDNVVPPPLPLKPNIPQTLTLDVRG